MGRAPALIAAFLAAVLRAPEAGAQTPPVPAEPKPAAPLGSKDGPRPALPPRAAIGGLRSLETTSTLAFEAAGAQPHVLVATFAFPARARLQLSAKTAAGPEPRELRYRAGEQVFAIGALDKASKELLGDTRIEVLRDLELRTAVFLWPDGFDWKGQGELRECARGALGTLRARFEPDRARPASVELVDAEGRELLALRRIAWVEERGRSWPAAFEAWRAGALVWKEQVDARDTTRTKVDSFFYPADRREAALIEDSMLGVVQDQDLPRFAARRVELAPGLDWPAARAAIDRLRAEWTEKLRPAGLALEPNATVELGERLEPRALLVRLAKEPATLPEGFTWIEKRPGRTVFVASLDRIAEVDLAELRRGLPAKARLAPVYVRVPARAGPLLVVQPWTRGE